MRAWHRIALGDAAIVIAHFTFAAPAAAAADLRSDIARAVEAAELNPAPRPYRPDAAARP